MSITATASGGSRGAVATWLPSEVQFRYASGLTTTVQLDQVAVLDHWGTDHIASGDELRASRVAYGLASFDLAFTFRYIEPSGVAKSVPLLVDCSAPPPPLAAAFNPTAQTLVVGDARDLRVLVNGGDATLDPAWTCSVSNPSVLSVIATWNGCRVTAVAAGTASLNVAVTRGTLSTTATAAISVVGTSIVYDGSASWTNCTTYTTLSNTCDFVGQARNVGPACAKDVRGITTFRSAAGAQVGSAAEWTLYRTFGAGEAFTYTIRNVPRTTVDAASTYQTQFSHAATAC